MGEPIKPAFTNFYKIHSEKQPAVHVKVTVQKAQIQRNIYTGINREKETFKWFKISSIYLHFHWVSVNLAHILSSVLPLHPPNVERPRVVVVVRDAQSRVVRNHVLVDRQDRLRVRFDPRYLPREHPA